MDIGHKTQDSGCAGTWCMARSHASPHARYKFKRPIDLVFIFILLKTWNKIDNWSVESTTLRSKGFYNTTYSISSRFCLSLGLPNENHFIFFFSGYDKSKPLDRGNRRLTKQNNKLPVESKRREEKYIKHKTGLNWKRKIKKKTNTSTRSRRTQSSESRNIKYDHRKRKTRSLNNNNVAAAPAAQEKKHI